MLQRTFSSWGRFVGWRPRAQRPLEPADRRVWVRYPCRVPTTCQAQHESDGMRLSVIVHDISRGGLNLLADQRLEPGVLLAVELPGLSEQSVSTALAYVIRAAPQGDGHWTIGCSFLAELTEEDLVPFGVHRHRSCAADRRTHERYPCQYQATVKLLRTAERSQWPVQVVNISISGAALLLTYPVEIGTLLSLEIRPV